MNHKKPITIGESVELYSNELKETRVLNIYLPEGYRSEDTGRYSVIYLLDGGMDEDFLHVSGLVQFNSFPWINRLQKSIVVGIGNVDRQRDFTYPTGIAEDRQRYKTSGHSDRFMAFLEKEVLPFVQRNYNVNKNATLVGESLGGLFASELLFKKPGLFNQYVIISPSLWWDNASLLQWKPAFEKDKLSCPLKVYIGVGKEGVWPAKIPHVMEVDANLLADKLKVLKNPGLTVFFDYLPAENHATIGHQALLDAFRFLAPPATDTN